MLSRCLQLATASTFFTLATVHADTSKIDQSNPIAPLRLDHCIAHIPSPDLLETGPYDAQAKMHIDADQLTMSGEEEAEFTGNVEFTQSSRSFSADRASLNQQQQVMDASGNITYQDPELTVHSQTLSVNIETKDTKMSDATYQMHNTQVRGDSEKVLMSGDNIYVLDDASYTTCPPDDVFWSIRASEIEIDGNEEWAKTKHARLNIYDVPVLYLPYFSYPIGDQRHTGFLFPKASLSTKNGFDLATPFYWNIAPNYDATFTPRMMTQRGQHLHSEFRYLKDEHNGQLHFGYIGNDKIFEDERYLVNWRHDTKLNQHWAVDTDYTYISDDNYFNDFGESDGVDGGSKLLQSVNLNYGSNHWTGRATIQDYQVLGTSVAPHTLLPQVGITGTWRQAKYALDYNLSGEISNFSHSDDSVYTATRTHIEPSIRWSRIIPAGFFSSELALPSTYYSQKEGELDLQGEYNNFSGSRVLPKFNAHGGLNFDRSTQVFGEAYTQTLEPQIKYLYIPYKDQSHIGLYDTAALGQDYISLFRDNRYSGYDRIADANQFTVGLSTRYLDSLHQERLRLSVAQVFYIEKSQVALYPDTEQDNSSTSALVVEADTKISDTWFAHSGLQYDSRDQWVASANAAVEWRPESDRLVQLNYRYVREDKDYIGNNASGSEINQLGGKIAFPIRDSISLVGSYYHDLNLQRQVDAFLGLKYHDCCWGLTVSYQRELIYQYDDTTAIQTGEFDDIFSIGFEFIGLGGIGTSSGDMLSNGKFSYGRPFYLNN